MPRQSVWFVKTSLVYLAVGFTLGGLMLANKGVLISPFLFTVLPAHMEFLLMGWLAQLAMGVVFWITPRFYGTEPRGKEKMIWTSFWLFNLGIWLIALEPYFDIGWFNLCGRTTEALAIIIFGLSTWQRIKPVGK